MIIKCLQGFEWGFLEEIIIDQCGLIRVKGWSKDNIPSSYLKVNSGDLVTHSSEYRTYRSDIASQNNSFNFFSGFIIEYLCFEPSELYVAESRIRKIDANFYHADYENLLHSSDVFHRENIYGYGPPVSHLSEQVSKILEQLDGSVIDFGCGIGTTVRLLRNKNIEAFGIELSRDAIREGIKDDVSQFITLYDGTFPAPLANESFDHVICVEVLEHIPDYNEAIKEFVRISKSSVIITVPDISAIPLLHQHGVVPWHLLESTHVNFFTLQSLSTLLSEFFSSIQFIKINPFTINDTIVYTNLLVVCDNKLIKTSS